MIYVKWNIVRHYYSFNYFEWMNCEWGHMTFWLDWYYCSPFQIHYAKSSAWCEGHWWPGDRLLSITPCCSTGQLGLRQLPNVLSGSASADLWFTAAAQWGAQVKTKWLTACTVSVLWVSCGWVLVLPDIRKSWWKGVWPQNFILQNYQGEICDGRC